MNVKETIELLNTTERTDLTYGEQLNATANVETREEAEQYFKALVGYYVRNTTYSAKEVASICHTNIKYYAGYFSTETRLRVCQLFSQRSIV